MSLVANQISMGGYARSGGDAKPPRPVYIRKLGKTRISLKKASNLANGYWTAYNNDSSSVRSTSKKNAARVIKCQISVEHDVTIIRQPQTNRYDFKSCPFIICMYMPADGQAILAA